MVWENQEKYLQLMEYFTTGTIQGTEFQTQFFKIWYTNGEKLDLLKVNFEKQMTFQTNLKAHGLSN